MSSSVYDQVLELARRQLDAIQRGDYDDAIELIDARERLLHEAAPPQQRERDVIQHILRIDAHLNTAFRERMTSIREALAGAQRGRAALQGYRPPLRHSAMALDAAR